MNDWSHQGNYRDNVWENGGVDAKSRRVACKDRLAARADDRDWNRVARAAGTGRRGFGCCAILAPPPLAGRRSGVASSYPPTRSGWFGWRVMGSLEGIPLLHILDCKNVVARLISSRQVDDNSELNRLEDFRLVIHAIGRPVRRRLGYSDDLARPDNPHPVRPVPSSQLGNADMVSACYM